MPRSATAASRRRQAHLSWHSRSGCARLCATNACALPNISLHTIACSGVACPARFRAPTAASQNPAPCPLSPSPLARVPQK
eukprot:3169037-Prymnesium_polylepis.1